MIGSVATLAGVGFLLGFRHAFEPDHLAAVSTLATRQGRVSDAARLGLAWGVGHTLSVGAVALVLVLAGLHLPPAAQAMAELLVAALLIGLGSGVLIRHARRHRQALGPPHRQAHELHLPHTHVPPVRDARRSLGFGLAHGLAGSGAVVVLLVAAATTRAAQLLCLASFGAGTIVGMLGVSVAVLGAARAAAGRGANWATWVHLGAASASIAVGSAVALTTAGSLL